MVLVVQKPLEGPDLKPFCHVMVGEAPWKARREKLRVCDIPMSAITSLTQSIFTRHKWGQAHSF